MCMTISTHPLSIPLFTLAHQVTSEPPFAARPIENQWLTTTLASPHWQVRIGKRAPECILVPNHHKPIRWSCAHNMLPLLHQHAALLHLCSSIPHSTISLNQKVLEYWSEELPPMLDQVNGVVMVSKGLAYEHGTKVGLQRLDPQP